MRIDVFSIFPEMVNAFCSDSLLGRARQSQLIDLRTHDLRHYTSDVHRTVDDTPYGGGAGMVMKPEPWGEAIDALLGDSASDAVLTLALRLPGSRTADSPARLNATLMALSRILVPIDYATTDRFSHDPALPIPDWAILQPLRDLAGTEPGSDAAYLHMVSARRAANHLAHSLRSATSLLEGALA
jgi:hypothetical protein